MISHPFRVAYRELISDRRDRVSFWVLSGFLTTFILARFLVSHNPDLFLNIHGVHVHHFTYGIIVLVVAGFLALTLSGPTRPWLAALYGVGVALSFDEFGMWVRLTDNYNLEQSEDVMVGILVFLVVIVYVLDWLRRAARLIRRSRSKQEDAV